MQAIGQAPNEQQIREMIRTELTALNGDQEFVRKMRFGGGSGQQAPVELVGTKYARFGLTVADIEWLYDLQESLRGQKKVNGYGVYEGPSHELRRTFDAVSKAYYLPAEKVREIDRQAIDDMFPRIPLTQFGDTDAAMLRRYGKDKSGQWLAWQDTDAYRTAMRAMDTAETGYGLELIGAQYVGDLWEAARGEMRVANLSPSFEMTAPTAYLPVEVDFPAMLKVSQS
jgi:hypothetical protein